VFPLSLIKSHLIGKFVCLRGTVLRVSSIKVLVESIQFQCHDCKSKILIHFIDGKVRQIKVHLLVGIAQQMHKSGLQESHFQS